MTLKEQENNTQLLRNGEILTLNTLIQRFVKAGIEHPTKEAKKYLLEKEPENVIEFYDIYP